MILDARLKSGAAVRCKLQKTKKDLAESIVAEDKDFLKKLTGKDFAKGARQFHAVRPKVPATKSAPIYSSKKSSDV